MTELQLHRPVDERARAGLETVAASAEAACGHPVLGDGVWRDLATPSEGSAVVLASRGGALVGAMHLDGASVLGDDDGVVTGSLVVTPTGHGQGVASALVDMALGDLRDRSLSGLDYWVFGDAGDPDCASGPAVRELYQMRVALPLTNPRAEPVWPDGTSVRPFEPGTDDEAWVRVNNRAFVHDPDQGAWTLTTFRDRMAESWFDPAGFLLAEDVDGLAGFCWTKVHSPTPPVEPDAVGEIYVIGVDPDRQGTGLGRALVIAGLASLAARGVGIGMLFVDAANVPAVGLYEALGFATTRTDRMYTRAVDGTDR